MDVCNIRNKGLSLAIDDFGTGYSNFNYLSILPIHKLKIDRSFIQDQSVRGKNIVWAVLALARKLNLKVVGEGIETKSRLEFLFKNRCDEAQGYYFSKPLPRQEFSQFMDEHHSASCFKRGRKLFKLCLSRYDRFCHVFQRPQELSF